VRKWIGLVALVMVFSLPAAGQTQQSLRVNCGGPSYTDSLGQVWAADTGYNEGTASTVAGQITGTNDPALYQDGR
jgi:Malectin domain